MATIMLYLISPSKPQYEISLTFDSEFVPLKGQKEYEDDPIVQIKRKIYYVCLWKLENEYYH